ncbi:exported hypothetical protein [Candidatus Sulfotelmatomonas gaucii]|uniref:Lipoprotein n=1 Tax=Candidatus Sulfuritelmatomonas gaucii TaxID=2043161 RepID=A0A2N9LVY5_9BACT|nr:exported hypothetical protein [Candidatus Sulfotelmatomonas gaucii]
MRRIHQVLLALPVTGVVLCLSSCSGCSAKNAPSSPPASAATSSAPGGPGAGAAATPAPSQFYAPRDAVYDVTYTPNTVRIDFPTVQKTLRAVSPDGSAMVFDSSDPRLQGLTAGKVLLLEHLGVRKIVDVEKQGSQIGLITDDVSLTDFIQDGHIKFTAPLFADSPQAAVYPPPAPRALLANLTDWLKGPVVAYADTSPASYGMHAAGKVDNWEFEASGTRAGDGLTLTISATKDLGGLKAKVTATGKVNHVSSAFDANIKGGKMQDFQYSTPLQGSLQVTWAALTAGQNLGIGESRLALPPVAKTVIDVYGLPFLFQINVNLIFKPGFGTPHDAASGGFNLDYDGAGGLIIHGSQSSTTGNMQANPNVQNTTSSSLAAHGIVLAVNAPKISVSFGTDSFKEALTQLLPETITSWSWFQRLQQKLFSKKLSSQPGPGDFFKINGGAYVQLVEEFDYAASGPLSLVPCKVTHFNSYAQAGADAQVLAITASSPTVEWFHSAKTWRVPDSDVCGPK